MKSLWLTTEKREKRSLFPVVLLVLVWLGVCSGAALAAPSFQAAGAVDGGKKALDAAWPTHAVDDIALLIVETANQTATLSTPAGFVEVANSPQGTGSAGGSSSTRLTVFWARATSTSMATPRVADSGDNQVAQIVTFRGAIATGNPWDVTAGNVAASASSSFTIPGATTTVANTLVVAIVANGKDSNSAQTSGWTNAQLSGLTERTDVNFKSGNGGGFGVATGVMASIGNYGNTTGSLANSSVQGRLSIALKPPALLVDDDKVQCPTAGYTTIAAALAAAGGGDTIAVCPGTYGESNLTINKSSLTLVSSTGNAADVTVKLSGSGNVWSPLLTVSQPNVTVQGITLSQPGLRQAILVDTAASGFRLLSSTASSAYNTLDLKAANPRLSSVTLSSSADWQAAVYLNGATGLIMDGSSTITQTSVNGHGISDSNSVSANPTIAGVTINSAGYGIYLQKAGMVSLSNSTITATKHNGADLAGGSGAHVFNNLSVSGGITSGYGIRLIGGASASFTDVDATVVGASGVGNYGATLAVSGVTGNVSIGSAVKSQVQYTTTVPAIHGVSICPASGSTSVVSIANATVSASLSGIVLGGSGCGNSTANFSNLTVTSTTLIGISVASGAGNHVFNNLTSTGQAPNGAIVLSGGSSATFTDVDATVAGANGSWGAVLTVGGVTGNVSIGSAVKSQVQYSTTATNLHGVSVCPANGSTSVVSIANATVSASLYGILLDGSGNGCGNSTANFSNLTVTSTTLTGISINRGAGSHVFNNLTSTAQGSGSAISLTGGSGATFTDVDASVVGNGGYQGVLQISGLSGTTTIGKSVKSAVSYTATGSSIYGIRFCGASSGKLSISNASVSSSLDAISTGSGCSNGAVTLSNLTVTSSTGAGINLSATGTHSLSSLAVSGAKYGINVDGLGSSSGSTYANLTASSGGDGTQWVSALKLYRQSGAVLSGVNVITGKGANNTGIYLDTCTTCTVSGAIVDMTDQVGGNGIRIDNGSTNAIIGGSLGGNYVKNARQFGIWANSTNPTITNNTVEHSGYEAYYYYGIKNVYPGPTYNNCLYNQNNANGNTFYDSTSKKGNFWGSWPTGTGYSDTCTDANSDGVCDGAAYKFDGTNSDLYPLKKCNAAPPVVMTCVSPINSSTFASDWYTRVVNGAFTPGLVDASGNACSGTGCRLRLTDTGTSEATQVSYIKQGFPFGINKVTAEFDYWSYGGTGADGIAIAFSDPANPSGNNPPTAGGFGGSLGYANRTGVAGFTGGWLGVGLDEYGNYANPTEDRTGSGTGSGYQKSSVAIRGADYGFLAGNNSWSATSSNSGADGQKYRYRITLDSTNGGGSTAVVKVERDTTGSGNSYSTQLNYTTTDAPPSQLQLSFTGSTGASTNKHEIANLQVCYQVASDLPPLNTGSVKPDNFNCVESGADALTGHLYTKLAGTAFSFDVVAIKDGSVATTYAADADKPLTVELVDGSGSTACASRSAINPAVSSTLTFTKAASATDKGRKAISMTVGKAYPDLRCRVTDANQSPSKIACSSDDFSVRPTAVTLSTTPAMATPPSAGSASPIKAGTNFTLQATSSSSDNYSGTLTQDTGKLSAQTTSQDTSQQSGGVVGALTPSSLTANAVAVNAAYSEVGYLYLAPGAFRDDAFTAVDSGNGDCVTATTADANLSDSLDSSGKYGCSIGNKVTFSFGRFIPDHFDLSVGSNGAMSAFCSGFTYTGQAMGYLGTALPALTIKPMNAATGGAVTQNYQGVFQKLNASGVTITSPTADSTQLGKDGATKTALTATMSAGTLANSSGTMTYTLKSDDQFTYTRDANALVAAYTAAIPLAVTAVSDGEVAAAGTLPTMTPTGVSLRFGRLRLDNAYGSERLNMTMPLRAEYWTGQGFALNGDDGCTSLAKTAVKLDPASPTTAVSAAVDTSVANIALVGGIASLPLVKPTSVLPENIDVCIDLGPDPGTGITCTATPLSMPWLQGLWAPGTSYNNDPKARATFGVYRSLRKIIHRREVF